MSAVTTVFFDIGGVLLTNGWDRHSRRAVVDGFGLDWEEFRDRHDFVSQAFEVGEMSLDEYLRRTVFYRRRDFSEADFVTAMKAQSQPLPGTLDVVADLAAAGVFLATLNNESRELNEYRIETFGLDAYFAVFLSSCYLGVKKPDAVIYRMALDICHCAPEESLFVDDRALNLECAVDYGMRTTHFQSADQLRTELTALGVLG